MHCTRKLRPDAQAHCAQCQGEQFGIVAVRSFSGLMSSGDALAKAVRLGESQRPLWFRRSACGTIRLGKGEASWVAFRCGAVSAFPYVKMLGSETAQ
jgi:hypothetical protein